MTREVVAVGDKPMRDPQSELHLHAVARGGTEPDRVALSLCRPGADPLSGPVVAGRTFTLTIDQLDELVARLKAAQQIALDGADRDLIEDDDGVQLLKSSLDRWGVQEGAGDLLWFATEKEAREHFAYVGDLAFCESCEERFPIDDMETSSDDCYLCHECAEELRADARQTIARHSEPTFCDWSGTIADCTFEDSFINCPKCGGEMEEGSKVAAAPAPELGEVAAPETTRG